MKFATLNTQLAVTTELHIQIPINNALVVNHEVGNAVSSWRHLWCIL